MENKVELPKVDAHSCPFRFSLLSLNLSFIGHFFGGPSHCIRQSSQQLSAVESFE